jgi:hypothetical protein
MKRLYFLLLILVIASCNQQNKIKIDGQIKGAKEKPVYLKEILLGNTQIIDSARTNKKGEFSFKETIEHPKFYQLGLSNSRYITLLVKPGEKVELRFASENLNNYSVNGSEGSKKVKELTSRLASTKFKLDSLKNLYTKTKDPKKQEKIDAEYQSVVKSQRDSSIAFILDNMGSMASIMALYQKINDDNYVLYKNMDLQYIKLVADSLKKKYPDSDHVKALIANKDNLMKKYRNLETNTKFQKYAKQSDFPVPMIRLPNMEGDTISLKDIHEKMVLISFWSANNKRSLERNLKLKKVYKQYHPKGFEIYQVNLDTETENWKKAVKFDELPWISVGGKGRNQYYGKVYNITELPTDFLLNKNREIISKTPEIDDLKRTLSIALD